MAVFGYWRKENRLPMREMDEGKRTLTTAPKSSFEFQQQQRRWRNSVFILFFFFLNEKKNNSYFRFSRWHSKVVVVPHLD